MKVVNSVLEFIGNTPMIRLNRVTNGVEAAVLAKLEYLNPTGSVKDRTAARSVVSVRKLHPRRLQHLL